MADDAWSEDRHLHCSRIPLICEPTWAVCVQEDGYLRPVKLIRGSDNGTAAQALAKYEKAARDGRLAAQPDPAPAG